MHTAKPKSTGTNEMMETEDQVIEELREEFRQRLTRRLQDRLDAKEKALDDVRSLKKKGRSNCT